MPNMIRKRRQKAIVGARQIRNRVHAQLNEYYAQVENEDMPNLLNMPYEENNGNVGDIPGSFNEHLGRTMRQVTHQSYSNNSVREAGTPIRQYGNEQENQVDLDQENQPDSEPDSDYCFDDHDSLRIELSISFQIACVTVVSLFMIKHCNIS
ncbi:uncharacterized protein LOC124200353 isoform X1 [Daphnia pulex]|uniref:uncharacterized protein LOC124200353 isoform X1 n=1 Tax=Daphnia pulex TaxID=6669 RepID=UPI001EDE6CEA|nr:uncharacterized protein LOC124200353 isoform X1 [Daphnia pulex]